MPIDQGTVGPIAAADGAIPAGGFRQAKTGEIVLADNHARYYEATSRGRRFLAANQAAQAVSVALATTYTGLCLTNPANSGFNLVVDKIAFALSVAPAAIASIGIIGAASTTAVTHTTPLTVRNCLMSGGAGVGLVDSASTIPTPFWLQQHRSGFTAAALPSEGPVLIDMDGSIVVSPGSFIAIGALTAVTGLGSICWEEVAII